MGLEEKVKELIEYDYEREWLEFKVNMSNPDELGEYVSALANSAAEYGKKEAYFIWGIDDKSHKIVGTVFNPHQNVNGNEPLSHYLARQLSPSVFFRFDEVEIENKRIVFLTIFAADKLPISYKGIRYIRIGSSKEKINKYPEREINLFHILKNGLQTIENTPTKYVNLEFNQLFIYFGSKGLKLDEKSFKRNLNLLTEDDKYNILAQLLSDDSHINIRVGIFEGKDKTSNMISVREFGHKCLLFSLDELIQYMDVINIKQSDETNRIVERKEIDLFDLNILREAIINAFLYNKWVDNVSPTVNIFNDRIEVISYGGLAPTQTLEGFFDGVSIPVNDALSQIFIQLRLSERIGRGVPKIVNRYGRDVFVIKSNYISVNIPFSSISNPNEKNKERYDTNVKVLDKIKKGHVDIILEMKNNPNITKAELVKKLNLSKSTIDNYISFLQKNKYIERVGSNKTGIWHVISNIHDNV